MTFAIPQVVRTELFECGTIWGALYHRDPYVWKRFPSIRD